MNSYFNTSLTKLNDRNVVETKRKMRRKRRSDFGMLRGGK